VETKKISVILFVGMTLVFLGHFKNEVIYMKHRFTIVIFVELKKGCGKAVDAAELCQ